MGARADRCIDRQRHCLGSPSDARCHGAAVTPEHRRQLVFRLSSAVVHERQQWGMVARHFLSDSRLLPRRPDAPRRHWGGASQCGLACQDGAAHRAAGEWGCAPLPDDEAAHRCGRGRGPRGWIRGLFKDLYVFIALGLRFGSCECCRHVGGGLALPALVAAVQAVPQRAKCAQYHAGEPCCGGCAVLAAGSVRRCRPLRQGVAHHEALSQAGKYVGLGERRSRRQYFLGPALPERRRPVSCALPLLGLLPRLLSAILQHRAARRPRHCAARAGLRDLLARPGQRGPGGLRPRPLPDRRDRAKGCGAQGAAGQAY
mmetsp:Transcript_136450/g.436641  ORF Transcript_136450/g.436641 Transcript_136450/m.436641 type:complete len:315 (-) Transcript_136450:1032-1976(-)